VVSLNRSWVKVRVEGFDDVSVRYSEVSPAKPGGSAAKKAKVVARASPGVPGLPPGAYPAPTEASSRGLHASKAASALGVGSGAAGGAAAGKFVAAVVQHEVEHVRAGCPAAARPLADLLERAGNAAAAAVPAAVAAARARRILGKAVERERELELRLDVLKREEAAWAALEASDDPLALLGGVADDDGEEEEEDDDDEGAGAGSESGPGFELALGKGLGATQAVEKAALALAEIDASVKKLSVLSRAAVAAERDVAAANKAHHFDHMPGAAPATDAKSLIRSLAAGGAKRK